MWRAVTTISAATWVALTALLLSVISLLHTLLLSRRGRRVDIAERRNAVMLEITNLLISLDQLDRKLSDAAACSIEHIQHRQDLVTQFNEFDNEIMVERSSLMELYERIMCEKRESHPEKLEVKRGILNEKALKLKQKQAATAQLIRQMHEVAQEVTGGPGITVL